jgi:hypothetical protein
VDHFPAILGDPFMTRTILDYIPKPEDILDNHFIEFAKTIPYPTGGRGKKGYLPTETLIRAALKELATG